MTTEYEGYRHTSLGWRVVAVCLAGWIALLAVGTVIATVIARAVS